MTKTQVKEKTAPPTNEEKMAELEMYAETLISKNREIQASEDRYRSLFDNASIAIYVIDRNSGKVLDANKQGRALLGWGAHLPVGETFILGGNAGFPGIKAGERRGDRVATVGITGTRWVQGPVYARLELAAGSAATGGPILPTREWAVGAGAGLVVSTPFGSILVSGGLSSFGRSAQLVQVGEH